LPNLEHNKLIEVITNLDEVPEDTQVFSDWIQAETKRSAITSGMCARRLPMSLRPLS
jgi:hypothetical protein